VYKCNIAIGVYNEEVNGHIVKAAESTWWLIVGHVLKPRCGPAGATVARSFTLTFITHKTHTQPMRIGHTRQYWDTTAQWFHTL
jgi:hypothetical protein